MKLVWGKTNITLACPEARIQEVVIPNCGMTDEELFPSWDAAQRASMVGTLSEKKSFCLFLSPVSLVFGFTLTCGNFNFKGIGL